MWRWMTVAYLLLACPALSAATSEAMSLHPLEVVPETEARDIDEITTLIEAGVRAQFERDGFATRDAHAKHHGCVNATVSVLDDLPAAYAVGVFAKPDVYRAIIRFSNGMGSVADDREGDARGFAMKLLGVPGDKVLDDERDAKTQDFSSKEALTYCENLSFSPWHTLPEHRPIGGIQRARKDIYQAISKVRHELNKQPRNEP